MHSIRCGLAAGLLAGALVMVAGGQGAGAAPEAAALAAMAPAARATAYEQAFRAASRPVPQLVALYRLEDINRLLPLTEWRATLTRLAATPNLNPLVGAEVTAQQAMADLRAGDNAAAEAAWSTLGEIEHWQAVGPFDNASPSAIATVEGPEKSTTIDLHAHYQGKQRRVTWRPLPYSVTLGEVNLGAFLSPGQSASAYLVTWVRSDSDQPVALRLRDAGSTRVWVNGALAFEEQASHPTDGFDQHAAGTRLRAGWNEILVKSGDSETSDWHFALRVTTPEGQPLHLTSVTTPEEVAAAAPAATAPAVGDLTVLAKAAATNATGDLDYAWVLNRKHNFNTGDHDDANAFLAATAAAPDDVDAWLDFVEHDSDQSRRYQNVEHVLAAHPDNPRAQLDLGTIELGRGEYWPARAAFWAALGETSALSNAVPASDAAIRDNPPAALGMLECYAGMGSRPMAVTWIGALQAAYGTPGAIPVAVTAPIANELRRMGLAADSSSWLERAYAQDRGSLVTGLQLADAQRQSGELTAALATVRAIAARNGTLPVLLEAEARALSGLDRGPEALALIERAVALAPDTASLRVAEGEIQRHLGHAAAAVAAWQTALNLNPQDVNLRDRLRIAQGGEQSVEASFERPYTQDLDQAMAAFKSLPAERQAGLESGPVTVLANVTVVNIFPSGNPGRYVQQIFRVNNRNGADSLSVFPVTYDPGTEQVRFLTARVVHADGSSADAPEPGDQPVSQAVGYETYYNVRNKFVVMPPMHEGDFVEIAYRTLPTTLESLYGDYFGDIAAFGAPVPTRLQKYVVIAPADKHLFFKAVRFPGQHEESTSNGQTVYQWTTRDLAAQASEPLSTPAIEQQPYVAISAFQTWDQFANWYRGLIRDTFVMDSEMVATVNRLVAGKTTEAEKVDAIYRWVIQNTHYIALEFGIHGYRPYPVTQVFHRRFGDCKDKASLLIAMLHQAGISSEFVLVRIRDLGVLDATIPSVADFDHAIVYVPGLKLYLDGTAEYEGANELPAGDQRAFVLRVPVAGMLNPGAPAAADPAPEAPVVTAEQPATANVMSRTLNGQIDAQGNLRFDMNLVVGGGSAPQFRQALEIPDRRAGALQAMLHDRLPGIEVSRVTVEHEDDWDLPIAISFSGVVPRFASVNGTTLLIPRQIVPQSWLPQMAALGARSSDVLAGPPQIIISEMRLALPPGFQISALTPPTQSDQKFAIFQADANLNGTTLTLRSRIETRQSLIPPATYPAFRTFWQLVDATLGRPIAAQAAAAAGGAQ